MLGIDIKKLITMYTLCKSLSHRWLIYNPKDQDGQLQWLADTLLQAESAGEKVHILGHIPSGDSSCLRTWSREFHKIIERLIKYYITDSIRNETTKSIQILQISCH
jgi:hypothetical protein